MLMMMYIVLLYHMFTGVICVAFYYGNSFFFPPWQNQDSKHRTYVYVLTVTETLEDWEDSVNIGELTHNRKHNSYLTYVLPAKACYARRSALCFCLSTGYFHNIFSSLFSLFGLCSCLFFYAIFMWSIQNQIIGHIDSPTLYDMHWNAFSFKIE